MFSSSLNWMRQQMKSGRFRYAAVFAVLALVLLMGVVQADGPMRPPQPPMGGMDGMGGMGGMDGMGGQWGDMGGQWGDMGGQWGDMGGQRGGMGGQWGGMGGQWGGMGGQWGGMGGQWGGMGGWWPTLPVPTITILAVVKDQSVTFSTSNLPEDEEFEVLMGLMYTRGVDGISVGSFNSSDGVEERTYTIPAELVGEYQIAVRIQTDHDMPYYGFNWFYNNDSPVVVPVAATDTADAAAELPTAEVASITMGQSLMNVSYQDGEEEELVPSFIICGVEKNVAVAIETADFPADQVFNVQMGVMPYYPEAEPYYDGKMKQAQQGMGMGQQQGQNMGSQQGQNMGSQQGQNTGPQQGMEMGPQQGMEMGPPQQGGQGYPPSMPTDMYKPMKPPMHWIPYYDAGTLETGEEGGVILADFEIPAELNGAYRISMLMRTDHTYPYYSYNWFYNNSAIVCEP